MVKIKRKPSKMPRRLNPRDSRIKKKEVNPNQKAKEDEKNKDVRRVQKASSALFFAYNTSLGPPYRVLLDTNFINFSLKNKLDIIPAMIECLSATTIVYITDCVMAELEKLGPRFRMALKIAKDKRFEKLKCIHKGVYADDCLVRRVEMHKCYIVATCDRNLKRRIRKIPGVPIMFISRRKYTIERLPEVYGGLR